MKEIVSIAASHLTAHPDDDCPVALTEIVLVTAESEYYFDDTHELNKRRACETARFAATIAELREIASTLTTWADERERLG